MNSVNPHSTQPASIETSQPKTETFPTPAHPYPRFLSKKIAMVALFIILILFSVLSVSAYLALQKTPQKSSSTVSISTQPSPLPTPDPTKDWKTYTDPTNLFSFKYPPDLPATISYDTEHSEVNIISRQPTGPYTVSQDFHLSISATESAQPLTKDQVKQWYLSIPTSQPYTYGDRISHISDYKNGIIDGVYFEVGGHQSNSRIVAYVGNKRIDISFNQQGSAGGNSIIDQILSTFKFTD